VSLKIYKISLFNLSVVGFRCQSCCSSKSLSFLEDRSLSHCSTVVSSKRFVDYIFWNMSLTRQIRSVFDADPTFDFFQLDRQFLELACWSSRR